MSTLGIWPRKPFELIDLLCKASTSSSNPCISVPRNAPVHPRSALRECTCVAHRKRSGERVASTGQWHVVRHISTPPARYSLCNAGHREEECGNADVATTAQEGLIRCQHPRPFGKAT